MVLVKILCISQVSNLTLNHTDTLEIPKFWDWIVEMKDDIFT